MRTVKESVKEALSHYQELLRAYEKLLACCDEKSSDPRISTTKRKCYEGLGRLSEIETDRCLTQIKKLVSGEP